MRITSAILLLSAAGLGFTACSSDDDNTPATGPANQVSFNVTVPRAQRAATTTGTISQFYAWTFVDGKEYMPGVSVSRTGTVWEAQPVIYWPADGQPVNFYCVSPMVGDGTQSNPSEPDIKGYVNTDGTTDLLYAVTLGATTNPVRINFRHALSRLAFNFKRSQASSTQSPLKVEVKGVTVTAVNTKGSFNYPHETTSMESAVSGVWRDQSSPADAVISQNETVVLTDSYMNINSTGYEFVIPQDIAESAPDYSGAYVKVLCSVYDESSGVKLWPAGQAEDYLYFPLNASGQASATHWEPGKAYAYNITIGVPADSGKIEFDITVDEYQQFEGMEIE